MTRKRFIKQLMAHGVSRNRAVAAARQKPAGQSYKEYFPMAVMGILLGSVSVSVARMAKAARALTTALVAASGSMSSMCEAFRAVEERRIEEEWRPIYPRVPLC